MRPVADGPARGGHHLAVWHEAQPALDRHGPAPGPVHVVRGVGQVRATIQPALQWSGDVLRRWTLGNGDGEGGRSGVWLVVRHDRCRWDWTAENVGH